MNIRNMDYISLKKGPTSIVIINIHNKYWDTRRDHMDPLSVNMYISTLQIIIIISTMLHPILSECIRISVPILHFMKSLHRMYEIFIHRFHSTYENQFIIEGVALVHNRLI